ncbi:EmrB/QacA family drug resistance transporter, partial [Klebsiella pneumoniae]|nr:EmrB/QacA family drug resistance transporter [Klebsiella pneumoniae]
NTEIIAGFITLLKLQSIVLSLADSYLLMTGFAVLLLLLTVWLPKRVWPPQTLFNLQ